MIIVSEEERKVLESLRRRVVHHFDSLEEAVFELSKLYSNQQIELPILGWRDNQPVGKKQIPRFLFRGESGVYAATVSARARLEQKYADQQWVVQRQKMTELLLYCAEVLSRLLMNPNPDEVVGFLQHYGLPTATVDITGSLDVAAFFASYGVLDRVKMLGVIPVELVIKHRRLADLRGGRLGERPDKQNAFVIYQHAGDDYKSDQTCELLGIKWYSFALRENDQEVFHRDKIYLEEVTDPYMGLLPLLVREFERDHGTFHQNIRAENLDKIPNIPLVLNEQGCVVVQPKNGQNLLRIMSSKALAGLSRAWVRS